MSGLLTLRPLFAASKFVASSFLAIASMAGPANVPAALAQEQAAVAPAPTEAEIRAIVRLADLYFEGETIPPDQAKAFELYRQAAAAGSEYAKLQSGQMLARGQGVAPDVEEGRRIVKSLADTGNASALLALGDLYARGDGGPMEPRLAVQSYEKAAELGNSVAMMRLGDIYRYGRFAPSQSRQAATYFRKAADAGNLYGLVSLGQIYLDSTLRAGGSPAEGMNLLKRAEEASIPHATIAISDAYLSGGAVKRDVNQAIAVLATAAERGNSDAAKAIIQLYRDGERDGRVRLVRRDLKQARAWLAKTRGALSPADADYEAFLIDAAAATSVNDYRKLYDGLNKLPPSLRTAAVRESRVANENVYFYFAQAKLRELKLVSAQPNGRFDSASSGAIQRFCRTVGTPYFCNMGPMSDRNAEILSYAFATGS